MKQRIQFAFPAAWYAAINDNIRKELGAKKLSEWIDQQFEELPKPPAKINREFLSKLALLAEQYPDAAEAIGLPEELAQGVLSVQWMTDKGEEVKTKWDMDPKDAGALILQTFWDQMPLHSENNEETA